MITTRPSRSTAPRVRSAGYRISIWKVLTGNDLSSRPWIYYHIFFKSKKAVRQGRYWIDPTFRPTVAGRIDPASNHAAAPSVDQFVFAWLEPCRFEGILHPLAGAVLAGVRHLDRLTLVVRHRLHTLPSGD